MIRTILHRLKDIIELYAPYKSFDRPIFIIAPPRSGSTFLFNCLSQFEELYSLKTEADYIWWRCFPYETMKAPSDYLGIESASSKNIRAIRRLIYKQATSNYYRTNPNQSRAGHLFGLKKIRYLDKTIANCFHLQFLDRAFPDAQYVFLVRDPRANISSMIDGWPYLDRFGKPQLSHLFRSLQKATIGHWTYPAPPGWQKIVSKPVQEVCAWSWRQHITFAVSFFEQHHENILKIRYEDLVNDTINWICKLAVKLDLKISKKVIEYIESPPLSRTTISTPYDNKWKANNYERVLSILPSVKDTAVRIGYDVSFKSVTQ